MSSVVYDAVFPAEFSIALAQIFLSAPNGTAHNLQTTLQITDQQTQVASNLDVIITPPSCMRLWQLYEQWHNGVPMDSFLFEMSTGTPAIARRVIVTLTAVDLQSIFQQVAYAIAGGNPVPLMGDVALTFIDSLDQRGNGFDDGSTMGVYD